MNFTLAQIRNNLYQNKAVHKDLTNPIVQTQNHSFQPANLFIVAFNTSNR